MLPSPESIAPHAPATPDDIEADQRHRLPPRMGTARKMWLGGLAVLLTLVATIALLVLTQFGPLADAAGGCGGG